ncbi:hypothetical protein CMV_027269 [Castanea mollissima]|uniref:Uncharacterized protein n=1 Tax=Castanea mollissima TaxID=60419 RepID=A0A8J4V2X1_9ROSI|nr:hypothetical protein CMV_027269 [Castanea mollissima]
MGMEIVRKESPNIFRKRSRLCNYEDALEVLRGNKGSEKIRGIMLHSPTPVQVQLHPEAFKMMENLIFLMVYNVEISEELTYFPSGLRLLEWPNYPFDFPSNFGPQQLVDLKMPKSCITLEMMSKQLQEIPRLPQSIIKLDAKNCRSLDLQSSWRLLDQFGEIAGILPRSNVLINSEKEEEKVLDDTLYFFEDPGEMCENLLFWGVSHGFGYMLDPSEVYHIEVVCEIVGYNKHDDDDISILDNTDFIKWMGVHVECICCCSGLPITKQRRVSSPMDLADLGFPDGFDLGSSSMTQILDSTRGSSSVLDDTEQLPLPPVSPTSYCSDLDHGVSNSGGHSRRARIRLRRQIRIRLRRKSLAESRALLQPLPCGKTGLKMKPLLTLAIFVILIQSLLLLHFANNT